MVMENLEEPGTASKAKLPRRGAKYVIMMFNDHELEDEKLARLCGAFKVSGIELKSRIFKGGCSRRFKSPLSLFVNAAADG